VTFAVGRPDFPGTVNELMIEFASIETRVEG
jgi:hypothetical protein